MKIIKILVIFACILQVAEAQITVESHMMGHSLMDHSSTTEQTKIAYWINEFSTEAGHVYESAG